MVSRSHESTGTTENADAVANKGAPLQNCFGFIDGTVRAIARPDTNQ